MLDELREAMRKGGLQGLASALAAVAASTRAAADAETRFAAVVNSSAGFRARVTELTRTQALMQTQARMLRERVQLEARARAVQTGDYARQQAATRNMERQAAAAARMEDAVRLRQRLGAVRSGQFRADDRAARAHGAENERVGFFETAERLKNRMGDARSGVYTLNAIEKQALARREQMVKLAEREAMVKEGGYREDVRAGDRVLAKAREVEKLERRAAYEARLGRRFGTAAYFAEMAGKNPLLRGLTGLAGGAGAAAAGGAFGGFQGTVEWNRFQLEISMVNRELAGSFLPALTMATKALGLFRGWLEGLSPREQNLLMLGGGAAGAAILARATGATRLIAGGAALLAGGGRWAAGAGASALMAGGNWSQVPGVTGAAAGASRWAAAGRFLGKASVPLAVASAGIDAGVDMYTDPNKLRSFGRQALRAPDMLYGGELARMFGYKSGGPLGQAYDWAFGDGRGGGEQQVREGPRRAGANPDRRRPTPADAGFEAPGAAFERITNRLALTGQDTGATSESLLTDIKNFLMQTFGADKAPPRQEP